MTLWYLSFSGPEHFLGACVVEADTLARAITEAHYRDCNPGGEVIAIDVPEGERARMPLNTLFSREQLEARFGPLHEIET